MTLEINHLRWYTVILVISHYLGCLIQVKMNHAIPRWQRVIFRLIPLTQRLARAIIYWQRELLIVGFVYRPRRLEEGMKIGRRHLERKEHHTLAGFTFEFRRRMRRFDARNYNLAQQRTSERI